MYYSSPFKHQERGREDKKHGKLTKEEEAESISGMLNNFSKALGEYNSSSIFYFKGCRKCINPIVSKHVNWNGIPSLIFIPPREYLIENFSNCRRSHHVFWHWVIIGRKMACLLFTFLKNELPWA